LGTLGLHELDTAQQMLNKVLELDATHAGSKVHLDMAKQSAGVTN